MAKNLSRMTIDIPEEVHKKLKAMAAVQGKSMRQLVMESINERLTLTSKETNEDAKLQEIVEKAIKKHASLLKKLSES